MKTAFALLCLLAFAPSCHPPHEADILQLHRESRQAGDETAPLLEQLIQHRNSINVQGRALTPEEIAFAQQVDSLESVFAQWNKDMEKAEDMQPGKERLSLEKSLKDAIIAFKKQVMALAPPMPH